MGLLDVRLPNASADTVAVFDENFNQVFSNARPIKAKIYESAKVMEHPVETGVTVTDHRVIEPVEIELSMILTAADYRSVFQQIKQIYIDATLLTVQTKTDSYQNMIISAMPHDEDPELFDAVAVAVKLEEVKFVTAQFGTLPASKVANPTNASTIQKGEQQTEDANGSSASILYGLFN